MDEPDNVKLFILCRMLFFAKPKMEFREPFIGGLICSGGTTGEDWQFAPIEIVNGVPFLVMIGREITGRAEHPYKYVVYCTDKCDWNDFVYKRKTAEEKQKALEKMLTIRKWKQPLSNEEKKFLSSQIE
jgi:hypothetical protein